MSYSILSPLLSKPITTCEDIMAKGPRVIVTLECTEARKEGASPSRYTTSKNKKTTPERLEMKKYNPNLRRHTVHKEIK
jgi:large subunit ribosomal protein L33